MLGVAASVIAVVALSSAEEAGAELAPAPKPAIDPSSELYQSPVPYLSPEESQKLFHLPKGYRLERVLSEPQIKEPVAIEFDGNGRMYVAEMRTYMQNIEGTSQHDPQSRVSLHWDSDGDGTYDQHSVFIDGLVLPRMMLALDGSLLVAETDANDIYEYRDTDGDGAADEKSLFYDAEPSRSNLEHQTSGLVWAADNWIYTTYNPFRLRWTPDGVEKEPTAPNGGQWGLAQDNDGQTWFVDAGGEKGPVNFQQPIVYGAFNIDGQFAPGFEVVYPLVPIPDVQAGPRRARDEEKTLNHFTATCGPAIFRGDRLPENLVGDLLFAEPVGRLVRRAEVEVNDGVTTLRNVYDQAEFIRSTDPNFRPVNMTTAPDGTLYIVDMYRGIIQESNWVPEGGYLYEVIKEYGLQHNFGRGRIWRLVHEDDEPGPQPTMLDDSPEQLVAHLAHPNGWWRDMAQRLLILRQAQSVVPALERMARIHEDHLARFHAIWTLEGLGALTPGLVRQKLEDDHPRVRIAAIRASETLFKSGQAGESLRERVLALMEEDPEPGVVTQVLLTADYLKWPTAMQLARRATFDQRSRGVRAIAAQLLPSGDTAGQHLEGRAHELYVQGGQIYMQLCASCHGQNGRGAPMGGTDQTLAPPLNSPAAITRHRDAMIKAVLHGVTGPINGETYPGVMIGMGQQDDEWVAAVTTYVRNSFGNEAPPIFPEDVARVRKQTAGRREPWTADALRRGLDRPLGNRDQWKLTASHNEQTLGKAIDDDPSSRYTTEHARAEGMWVRVELPSPATISRLVLDSRPSSKDYLSRFTLELSEDGERWRQPEGLTTELGPLTRIGFEPTRAKFIRITKTGPVEHSQWWSIHELYVFQPYQTTAAKGSP